MPTAHEHLAAFETEHLGEDVERHVGKVEKGSGSRFSLLSHEHRARHAALEELIESETALGRAQEALNAAQARHAAVANRAGVDLEETAESESDTRRRRSRSARDE